MQANQPNLGKMGCSFAQVVTISQYHTVVCSKAISIQLLITENLKNTTFQEFCVGVGNMSQSGPCSFKPVILKALLIIAEQSIKYCMWGVYHSFRLRLSKWHT